MQRKLGELEFAKYHALGNDYLVIDEERFGHKLTPAAQAKLYTGELSNRAVNSALQIHGGYGFMDEFPISRLYRDVRVTTIYEGTSEMQRLVISRHLLRSAG